MSDFRIKRGDTLPPMRAVLTDEEGPFDLTDCTIVFRYMHTQSGAAIEKDADISGGDPTQGKVIYNWESGDTDTPGIYFCEWVVTTTGGKEITFPNGNAEYFEILDDVRRL